MVVITIHNQMQCSIYWCFHNFILNYLQICLLYEDTQQTSRNEEIRNSSVFFCMLLLYLCADLDFLYIFFIVGVPHMWSDLKFKKIFTSCGKFVDDFGLMNFAHFRQLIVIKLGI